MGGTLLIGAQWGDEGKAKYTDYLAQGASCVVRYQGGHNAGHTVVRDGKTFVFHMVPSGVLREDVICAVGGGTVVDPAAFLDEIEFLEARGLDLTDRLWVSDRAHVILPYHVALDRAEEGRRAERRLGTTGRGIGPAYQDKVARRGVRMADLLSPTALRRALQEGLELANFLLEGLYRSPRYSLDGLVEEYTRLGTRMAPWICDLAPRLESLLAEGKQILFEGAQGIMLDLDLGTYPFVTSSNPGPGGVLNGLGLPPCALEHTFGVFKAYCTRVGEGPFPSELNEEDANRIRQAGREFGSTTGRPRRVGWLDLVALRHAVRASGVQGLLMTKVDVLDGFDELGLCTAYRSREGKLDNMPADLELLESCRGEIERLPGWERPSRNVQRKSMLPVHLTEFIRRVEEEIGIPVLAVSTGPDRKSTVPMSQEGLRPFLA